MSDPIGPGDWVECVGASARPDLCAIGGIYCVAELVPAFGACPACGDASDTTGLLFVGQPLERVPGGHGLMSWCPCRFRPIYRPKQSIIEALKAPPKRAPKRQREDA